MQAAKQEQLAKFQPFLKISVFSTPRATSLSPNIKKYKYVNKHCSSYVSWVFLTSSFNQIHKLVSILYFELYRIHFSHEE